MEYSPLLNHLVLEKIFDNLPLTDLKSCRLVCTAWNDVSIPHITKLAELYLEGGRLEQFLSSTSLSTTSSPANGLANGGSSDSALSITILLPFDTCVIKIGSIFSSNCNLRMMWDYLSVSLKYMTLHITTFYAHRELKNILWNLPCLVKTKIVVMKYWGTESTESKNIHTSSSVRLEGGRANNNLKSFNLCYLGFDEPDFGDGFRFPIDWNDFFLKFPKISHMSVIGLNSEDIAKMLETLEEIQAEESLRLGLKSLEILDESIFPEAPTDNHLRRISRLNFAFESLHLEISPVATPAVLNEAIVKHKNTLQSLRLRRYPKPFIATPINLPDTNLNFVTFLEISNGLLTSLSFLTVLPSLQILHVILRDYRSLPCCELFNNTVDPSALSHMKVKSLYIEPPLISKSCIEKLAICFPNLEALRLRVNNEMLGEICLQVKDSSILSWKNLRDLFIISWDGLTDEGLTGISEQILKVWANYSCFVPSEQRTMPYIGYLTGLHRLTIEMWPDYENHISDWSVYYGILDLKQLQEVTLIRPGISDTAFQSIPLKNKRILN